MKSPADPAGDLPGPFVPRLDGRAFSQPLGKIVCVGLNYANHAQEMSSPRPEQPVLFIKPATAAVPLEEPLRLPADRGSVHHEVEMALLIGQPLWEASPEQALAAVAGVGLAIDLTLRDVQAELKRKGHPWERAKAFDGAFPVSAFQSIEAGRLGSLHLELWCNGNLRQSGTTADLLFPVAGLIAEISHHFTLRPGDVVSTGTPAGVGPLYEGDRLRATLGQAAPGDLLVVETRVV